MNNNRYFSPPENTFMNFPNARSVFSLLILHGNLDEHIHSDKQTHTPVAKPNKTNDLAKLKYLDLMLHNWDDCESDR